MIQTRRTLRNTMTLAEKIFGWVYVIAQQFGISFVLIIAFMLLGLPLSDLWLNFAYFVINFIVVAAVFHKYLLKSLRQLKKDFIHAITSAVAGFVLYWASNILVSLLVYLLSPDFANSNDAYIETMAGEQYWIMFTGSVILVPIVEETLYRGVIFGTLDKYNRPMAYILSSLIFAAIHVVGYIGTEGFTLLDFFVSMLQYLPASVCLAWVYADTDTIFAPTLVHMTVNLIAMLSMR